MCILDTEMPPRASSKRRRRDAAIRITRAASVTVVAMAVLLCDLAAAEASDRPVVIIVRVGQDDVARNMERRFMTELGLYIDDFEIRETPPPLDGFVDTPLSRQISLIRPLMVNQHAIASMWLHTVSEGILLLQVVVLDTGRALVRLFERSLKEGSETALAATAAELLGTAYLFEENASEKRKPIKALVESTRKQAGVKASRPSKWRAHLAAFGQDTFVDTEGPALGGGGTLGVDRELPNDVFLGLALGGLAGPMQRDGDPRISGYEIQLHMDLFFGPALGRVRFGPVVKISGGPVNVAVKRPGFSREDFSQWAFRGGVGIQLRLPLRDRLSLTLASGVLAAPARLAVKLRSNDEIIYRMGILSGWASLGILLF